MISSLIDIFREHQILKKGFRFGRKLVVASGLIAFFLILFAFTSGPYWVYYWLGVTHSGVPQNPEYIVLLGGGGMPSKSGLMRSYYSANLAQKMPDAQIIIAIPADTSEDETALSLTQDFLVEHGVNADRIQMEYLAVNTRGQALSIASLFGEKIKTQPIVLVTCPEHLYRAVLTFRKAGFQSVGGVPAFENVIEADITYGEEELGGETMLPEVGDNINLRYRFWTHLQYEILIFREVVALAWYWLNGWV